MSKFIGSNSGKVRRWQKIGLWVEGWTLEKVYQLLLPLEGRIRHSGNLLNGAEQQMLTIERNLLSRAESLVCPGVYRPYPYPE